MFGLWLLFALQQHSLTIYWYIEKKMEKNWCLHQNFGPIPSQSQRLKKKKKKKLQLSLVHCQEKERKNMGFSFINGENYIFTRFSLWSLTFISIAFSFYPEKRVSFLFLPLYQRRKMHTWQMKCTAGTLKADVAIKIIIKKMLFGIKKWHINI